MNLKSIVWFIKAIIIIIIFTTAVDFPDYFPEVHFMRLYLRYKFLTFSVFGQEVSNVLYYIHEKTCKTIARKLIFSITYTNKIFLQALWDVKSQKSSQ